LEGEVAVAAELLSAPFRIRGMVTHGVGRGSKIGFPTANLQAIDTLIPKQGVYAGRAWHQGAAYPAAINLGPNPTFGENAAKVEVHLLEFQESLYGQALEVEFLHRLRDIVQFDGIQSLIEQLHRDVEQTRNLVASTHRAETA
jgi:riboflavin kinase/FMN adenylyltransferase